MNTYHGQMLTLGIFGQSHSKAIGMTLEGLPAGEKIDLEKLKRFLGRRAPGKNAWSTARREADEPDFVGGLVDGVLCGAPLCALICNTDPRSGDYEALKKTPRPGHADFAAYEKFFGYNDVRGGGQFSGRLTAPLCIAGGVCLQLLEKEGIFVLSRALSIGGVWDEGELTSSTAQKDFPTVSDEAGARMRAAIEQARAQGDSVGGRIEVKVTGLPAGLGEPMFAGLENRLSQMLFAIPAVKGVEFGDGFALADQRGSETNDAFCLQNGRVSSPTNHMGGILGGISNGMELTLRLAVKPTPSIALEQKSVNLEDKTETSLTVWGRHDPCIVPRALPCAEAACAIVLYDALLKRRSELYGAK